MIFFLIDENRFEPNCEQLYTLLANIISQRAQWSAEAESEVLRGLEDLEKYWVLMAGLRILRRYIINTVPVSTV